MKVIEQKYLPMIVNQFGGISSGYIHNHPDSNPIVKATMERFSKFVEEQDVDIKTAKNTTLTDMLYLFLSEDETISTDYKKIYEKELSKFSLNEAGNPNVYSDGLALNTVNDLYNENVQKVLTKNQSIVLEVLKPLLTKSVGLDSKIYRDATEFREVFMTAVAEVLKENIENDSVNVYEEARVTNISDNILSSINNLAVA